MAESTAQLVDVRSQFWGGSDGRGNVIGWHSGSSVPPDRAWDFAQELLDSAIDRHPRYGLSIVIGGRVVWRRVGAQLELPGVADHGC